MEVKLPYDGQTQKIDLDSFAFPVQLGGRYCCRFPQPLSQSAIQSKILAGLDGYPPTFAKHKLLIVVNDSYRRTPTEQVLDVIAERFENVEFVVATGSHRQPTESEFKSIFGKYYEKYRDSISAHDCHDKSSQTLLGRTEEDTPVYINNKALEADLILTINSVEPHFFAGYTGGRKSLFPGLAGFETIVANHRLAKNPDSRPLELDANPLSLDLEECLEFLYDKKIITIQCITDRNGQIVDLTAGALQDAFRTACSIAEKFYAVKTPHKFPIVLSVCDPPLDSNLYQLQKAQENGGRITAVGGVLIVVGACREGVGSEYFLKLAAKYPSPEDVLRVGIDDDSFGIHKLVRTAFQLQKFSIYYATNLDEATVKCVYFRPFKDVKSALDGAIKKIGRETEIAIIDDAGYTVPVLEP